MAGRKLTQAPFERVTGRKVLVEVPARIPMVQYHFKGPDLPVDDATWAEANHYCVAIGGRLPTEEEWEYAARGGSTGARYGDLDAVAWYEENSGGTTHAAGKKAPNRYGLYDMLGNVCEWVANLYPRTDPQTLRGGAWDQPSSSVRASAAERYTGTRADESVGGFRCAWDHP